MFAMMTLEDILLKSPKQELEQINECISQICKQQLTLLLFFIILHAQNNEVKMTKFLDKAMGAQKMMANALEKLNENEAAEIKFFEKLIENDAAVVKILDTAVGMVKASALAKSPKESMVVLVAHKMAKHEELQECISQICKQQTRFFTLSFALHSD